jgi:hypothetical protein
MKKILIPLTLSILVVGCATQKSVSNLPAKWRVDENGVTTGMPNYPLAPEIFARVQKQTPTRAPASTDKELAAAIEADDKKPSLRRLYFRSLYQSWREVAQMSDRSTDLRSCPQFHHDKVVLDEKSEPRMPFSFGAKPSAEHLPFYPEWALQVKTEQGTAPVWQLGQKKMIKRAMASHEFKLRRELKSLCEEGASDSYFRLENMVTYFSNKEGLQTDKGMTALLKIPVFSTMLLVKSVQGSPSVNFSSHDQELLTAVKGFQLQNYIVELKKERLKELTGSTR